jgi:renalase
MTRIAIIGAGIAGLTLARLLCERCDVVVFEKSTEVGGRMASRQSGDFYFDHGAQFFTARSQIFRNFLQPYLESGHIAPWSPRVLTLNGHSRPWKRDWFEPHYVGMPTMSGLCKAMAQKINLQPSSQVISLVPAQGTWQVRCLDGTVSAKFDWVISTIPAPQAKNLLPTEFGELDTLAEVELAPCFALLLGLDEVPQWNFDAARLDHPVLQWLSCEASRPGRAGGFAVTVHSSNVWAAHQWDADDLTIVTTMLDALGSLLPGSLGRIRERHLKRWRFAKAASAEKPLVLLDSRMRLAACGDWCRDGLVEGAFLSAVDLAAALRRLLEQQ